MKHFLCSITVALMCHGVAIATPLTPQLIPEGLNPGDKYHLTFYSSEGLFATSSNIADYDAFIQGLANGAGIGLGSMIGDVMWKAIGSTATVNAIDHVGVVAPVYLLDSTLVAAGESDLFGGTLLAPITLQETGDISSSGGSWTGSENNGLGTPGQQLGQAAVTIGTSGVLASWWKFGSDEPDQNRRLTGISEVLTVPPPAPEPSTLTLLSLSFLALIRRRRRK